MTTQHDALNSLDAMIEQAGDGSEIAAAQALQAATTALPAQAQQTRLPAVAPSASDDYSMDDAIRESGSNLLADFAKLTDGGLSVNDQRYKNVQLKLILKSASQGGSFKPFIGCNSGPSGETVYARCFSRPSAQGKVVNECSDARFIGQGWEEFVASRQKLYGPANARPFDGFKIVGEVVHAENMDGTTADALIGTHLAYTSTVTGSKKIAAVWMRGQKENAEACVVAMSGQDVSRVTATGSKVNYKELVLNYLHATEADGEPMPDAADLE